MQWQVMARPVQSVKASLSTPRPDPSPRAEIKRRVHASDLPAKAQLLRSASSSRDGSGRARAGAMPAPPRSRPSSGSRSSGSAAWSPSSSFVGGSRSSGPAREVLLPPALHGAGTPRLCTRKCTRNFRPCTRNFRACTRNPEFRQWSIQGVGREFGFRSAPGIRTRTGDPPRAMGSRLPAGTAPRRPCCPGGASPAVAGRIHRTQDARTSWHDQAAREPVRVGVPDAVGARMAAAPRLVDRPAPGLERAEGYPGPAQARHRRGPPAPRPGRPLTFRRSNTARDLNKFSRPARCRCARIV